MNLFSRRNALILPLGLAGLGAGCASPTDRMGVPADPSGRADPEMKGLLESFVGLGPRPIETLTPAEARRQPNIANAVQARTIALGRVPTMRPMERVEEITMSIGGRSAMGRLYSPQPASAGPLPVVLYFHGGGWVIANPDVYDSSARAIAAETGAIVIAVRYRQGPEVRFPGAHEDAAIAYSWLAVNAATIGGDPTRLAVAGESAGGNLAINAAIFARDSRLTMPRAIVAVYPVGGTDTETPSYNSFANARPLNKPMVLWFVQNYTNGPQDLQDPRLDIYRRANLRGLPRTILVNAEIDPLADDGTRLADALRAAGVSVNARVYPGVTHEFFGADAVLTKAKDAQAFVGAELKAAFAGAAPMARPAMRPVRPRPRPQPRT
ncbi:alpha/beta hydrolase [Muricoccus radiodurans]|uniref:alpha/beta hydrolase n=1 Tax=Muricoccus radiodurans TaxID=2231721 RepID=UPI003CF6D9BD